MKPLNFCWLDEFLAGSSYPSSIRNIDYFIENGITNIITLTMELPIVSKYTKSITFHHIPVSVEPSEEQINLFLKIIETIRNKGEKAVVHCQYGQERTGIFLVHYFMKFIDKNLDIAFKEVRKGRLSCLQNSNSKHHLVNYYT